MSKDVYSAARWLRIGFVSVLLLCAGLFGWGVHATLSGAVISGGKVETTGGDRIIEHPDGGAVLEILVQDGDRVRAGQLLVRLDGELLRSERSVLEAELLDLVARRNRLEAEFRNADSIRWDGELLDAVKRVPQWSGILEGHQRLFDARSATRDGYILQLEERIRQSRRQIEGLDAQRNSLERQSELIGQELEAKRKLLERKLIQLPEVLLLERHAASLQGNTGEVVAQVASLRGRIAELEAQILQISMNRIEEVESEARKSQAQENTVRERLSGLDLRIRRLDLRAPESGVVHNLSVSVTGEVLAPGEMVAKIVPDDAGFIVRARLETVHVDQVWEGQDVVLRFSAFSSSTTPEFSGTVRQVSADVLTDGGNQGGWYELEIGIIGPVQQDNSSRLAQWTHRLEQATWRRIGRWRDKYEWLDRVLSDWAEQAGDGFQPDELALTPGMPVEVYLLTGERTPLSYLVKPIADYFQRSFREN